MKTAFFQYITLHLIAFFLNLKFLVLKFKKLKSKKQQVKVALTDFLSVFYLLR